MWESCLWMTCPGLEIGVQGGRFLVLEEDKKQRGNWAVGKN